MNAQGSSAYADVNTLLEGHARRRPDKVFIQSPDQGARITFGELEALTRRFVNFLARQGIGHGRAHVGARRQRDRSAGRVLGGAPGRRIVNPINVEIREKHVGQILHDVAPKAVFWSRELAADPRRHAVRAERRGSRSELERAGPAG